MVNRIITQKLERLLAIYPIVLLTGPRQSGKSTLLRHVLHNYDYVSLEDLDMREFATTDPRGFIAAHPNRTVIDEAQQAPNLFSYLQTHIDAEQREGMYVLSGSQNFLLMQQITQSLAGRVGILELLPFSRCELQAANMLPADLTNAMFCGGYPRLYHKRMHPTEYYPYYIRTYVERDVRQIKNITSLGLFVKFLKLCAGRIGQLLNFSALANDCGIAVSTAQTWISVLEASYMVHLLRPDHRNFSKRLVKSPKLYFCDTGLACALLDIKSPEQIRSHYLRGGLFENYVIEQFLKSAYNRGQTPQLSFWRDSKGNEVDLLQNIDGNTIGYEIKSSSTFSPSFLKGLQYWAKLADASAEQCSLIYAGDKSWQQNGCNIIALNDLQP